jgi:hypothetical protein
MVNTDKISDLTESDILLIGTIVVGFTKMVYSITNTKPEVNSRSHSHEETKQLVKTFVLFNLSKILENKSEIRPSDIRKKLPEEWKKIQSSDLTDILNSLVDISVLTKVNKDIIRKQRWGRPPKNEDTELETGPKSFYQTSKYYHNLRKILRKTEATELIFSLLSHSGVLHKLVKHRNLVSYLIMKQNDEKKALNIMMTRNLAPRKKDFESDFKKVQNMENNELEDIADKDAKSSIQKNMAEDYKDLYIIGGIFFQA